MNRKLRVMVLTNEEFIDSAPGQKDAIRLLAHQGFIDSVEFVSHYPVSIQLRESWCRYAEKFSSEKLDRLIFVSDESCSILSQFHRW
jgi:hypothetical protein